MGSQNVHNTYRNRRQLGWTASMFIILTDMGSQYVHNTYRNRRQLVSGCIVFVQLDAFLHVIGKVVSSYPQQITHSTEETLKYGFAYGFGQQHQGET